MNKKVVLITSLIASAVFLTSLSIVFVQSAPPAPTEWYQTSTRLIVNEAWNWDGDPIGSPPWTDGVILYKMTGNSLFFTPLPHVGMPILVANRVDPFTWGWKGGEMVMGGPDIAHLMMFNGTISITFTTEDIPLTDDDNSYKGLRLLVEAWLDVYGLENVSEGQYLWQGLMRQHIIFWATKGKRAAIEISGFPSV